LIASVSHSETFPEKEIMKMAFNRIHFYSLSRPINGCGACRFEVFGKRHFKAEKKDIKEII